MNRITILDAITDPHLFAPWFERGDWAAWFAFLAALFALPMAPEQRQVYQACTGRTRAPEKALREAWLIVGRRGGKSFIVALIAVFLAAFFDYRPYLQRGERGTILILAADRKQARVIYRYVRAMLTEIPMLAALVERETTEGIDLTNRVSIEIGTASFRSVRSGTIVAALCDEIAFWRSDDSANPDWEILNAIRPGMATIPNAMLLALSSPYAKRGELYRAYRKYHGKHDPDVLVWQADTRTMNPTVPERIIKDAYERDPDAARAEYGAQFRSDIESFINRETVEASARTSPVELPYNREYRYFAFVDPSGGGPDGFCIAIGHKEGDCVVIDVVRERKIAPAAAVAEYAELLRGYCIAEVVGDKYAGSWPEQEFARHGIRYEPAARPKSELYLDMLSALNSERVELPPDPVTLNQICTLERRTGRSGKDSIDHAPGGHDDRANVIAGLIATVTTRKRKIACAL